MISVLETAVIIMPVITQNKMAAASGEDAVLGNVIMEVVLAAGTEGRLACRVAGNGHHHWVFTVPLPARRAGPRMLFVWPGPE